MSPIHSALLAGALLAPTTPGPAAEPLEVGLQTAREDLALQGRRVRIDACIAIPLIDNPSESDNAVVLYPCGAALDASLPDAAILGRIGSREVVSPFADAGVSFLGQVRATFVGTLSREGDDEPGGAYAVLAIEQVLAPSQFAPPPDEG
ncbi:hypothetical protein [Lysobacter humi (ex Lee et al. 2017)]